MFADIEKNLRKNSPTRALELLNNLNSIVDTEEKELYMHYYYARAYYLLGKNKEAYRHITKAKSLSKKAELTDDFLIELQIEYCKILRRTRRLKEAKEIYKGLLKEYQDRLTLDNKARILHNLGNIYMEMGDFDSSETLLEQALEINQQLNNKERIAISLSSLGGLNFYMGNIEKALNYYLKSYEIRKELGDPLSIANIEYNIGTLYFSIKEYDKALEFLEKAEKLFDEINHIKGVEQVTHTKSQIYFLRKNYRKVIETLSGIENELDQSIDVALLDNVIIYAESLFYVKEFYTAWLVIQKALEQIKALKSKPEVFNRYEGKLLQIMSDIYFEEKNYQKAIRTLQDLEKLAKRVGDKESLISIYLNIGKVYNAIEIYSRAEQVLKKAHDLANKFNKTTLPLIELLLVDSLLNQYKYKEVLPLLKHLSEYTNDSSLFLFMRTIELISMKKISEIPKEMVLPPEETIETLITEQEIVSSILIHKKMPKLLDIQQNLRLEGLTLLAKRIVYGTGDLEDVIYTEHLPVGKSISATFVRAIMQEVLHEDLIDLLENIKSGKLEKLEDYLLAMDIFSVSIIDGSFSYKLFNSMDIANIDVFQKNPLLRLKYGLTQALLKSKDCSMLPLQDESFYGKQLNKMLKQIIPFTSKLSYPKCLLLLLLVGDTIIRTFSVSNIGKANEIKTADRY